MFLLFLYTVVPFFEIRNIHKEYFFFIMIKVLAVKLTILIWAPQG